MTFSQLSRGIEDYLTVMIALKILSDRDFLNRIITDRASLHNEHSHFSSGLFRPME
jgi:hypothetical protein